MLCTPLRWGPAYSDHIALRMDQYDRFISGEWRCFTLPKRINFRPSPYFWGEIYTYLRVCFLFASNETHLRVCSPSWLLGFRSLLQPRDPRDPENTVPHSSHLITTSAPSPSTIHNPHHSHIHIIISSLFPFHLRSVLLEEPWLE